MGYGGASSSGGASGAGGSGGAFNDRLGLSTGTTWHGTSAFGQPGGMAQGYATRDQRTGMYGDFRSPTGQQMSGYTTANGYPAMSPKMAERMGYPGGYADPYISQPIPPRPAVPRPPVAPPPNIVPTAAPPPVAQPKPGLSFNYNYAYPPGMMYGNYFNNPTQRPQSYSPANNATYRPASAGGGLSGLGSNFTDGMSRGKHGGDGW